MTDVRLERLSEGMYSGAVVEWLVAVGDRVSAGDILCQVEADKVTFKIEAPASGLLSEIVAEEGDEVEPDGLLAVITDESST